MPKINPYGEVANYEKSGFFRVLPPTTLGADLRFKHDAGKQFNGIMLELIVSGASGLSFVPKIEVIDDAGNTIQWWAAATPVTSDGTKAYILMQQGGAPDFGSGILQAANLPLPRGWQVFLDWTAGTGTVEAHIAYL